MNRFELSSRIPTLGIPESNSFGRFACRRPYRDLFCYASRAFRLTGKETILLAAFTNATGDAVFDGTLRQGLAVQLEQSPLLKVMDEVEMQHDRHLMNLRPGTPIKNQVAHDVCVREGGAATIEAQSRAWVEATSSPYRQLLVKAGPR